MAVTVDRISADDLTQLACDVGPVPMNVGALLVLKGADADAVRATLARRLVRVGRFRQVLRTAPPGLGRPYWLVDPARDLTHHLATLTLDGPLDDTRLADAALAEVLRPLPPERPLWRVTVVQGAPPDDGGAGSRGAVVGVVLVMHHVLADGIGGLAVLLGLVDGAPEGRRPEAATVAAEPHRLTLVTDVWRERARAVRKVPAAVRTLHRGRSEIGASRRHPSGTVARPSGVRVARRPGSAACSINARTGPRRAVHLVQVDLAALRDAARGLGATVNDCLLVATTGALEAVLAARGEHPCSLVVSVPVSARRSTTTSELGNRVGVMPVRVRLEGTARERLARVAAETSIRKANPGSSAALLGPLFRALAAIGALGWFINRQRLVNAFGTNLRGPDVPVRLAGAEVTRIVPLTIATGNVSVAFAALSYAGRLGVTVMTDPDVTPEGGDIAVALEAHLAALLA